MAHRWLAIGLSVVVGVGAGCEASGPKPWSAEQADLTAHWTRSDGDGYLEADDPDTIADLLERYAEKNRGEVLNRETYHGDRPGGSVEVRFASENAGSECWLFHFRRPRGDAYVRDIEFDEMTCPS